MTVTLDLLTWVAVIIAVVVIKCFVEVLRTVDVLWCTVCRWIECREVVCVSLVYSWCVVVVSAQNLSALFSFLKVPGY